MLSVLHHRDYRRVKLLGVALYYIIYRSRDSNLCRAKRYRKSMESNGFGRISSRCITVSINYCQNYKRFSCTLTILGLRLEKDNEVTFLQGWL